MSAELDIVRAQLPGDAASAQSLQEAIAFFSRAEPGRVPRALSAAGAHAASADVTRDSGERAAVGIDRLEAQQAGLGDEALKISFFDESWALFQDMVALQVAAKRSSEGVRVCRAIAGSVAPGCRAGTRTDSRTRTAPRHPGAAARRRVVLVHYATLADRILIWTITQGRMRSWSSVAIDEREPGASSSNSIAASIRDRSRTVVMPTIGCTRC